MVFRFYLALTPVTCIRNAYWLNSSRHGKTWDWHYWHDSQLIFRADSRLPPSQWEMSLQSNTDSHWLGANLESPLILLLANTSQSEAMLEKGCPPAGIWIENCICKASTWPLLAIFSQFSPYTNHIIPNNWEINQVHHINIKYSWKI